jgi:2',3'-cyclic-nucleotide 2'-phosphodiesterase (5'-nucleotidase family)
MYDIGNHMKRAILLALLVVCASSAEIRKLTILHTNDLHARLLPDDRYGGGFAYLAAVLRREKTGCGHCLYVDAGDLVMGTPETTMFKGIPVVEIANRIAPDAFTLGNHDFDYGWRQVWPSFDARPSSPLSLPTYSGPTVNRLLTPHTRYFG